MVANMDRITRLAKNEETSGWAVTGSDPNYRINEYIGDGALINVFPDFGDIPPYSVRNA